jgi:hypothetical protein
MGNGATGGGTLLGTSAAGLVPASAFFSVELSAKIDASAGFIQIRVNGLPVAGASVVGVNTQQTSHAWFDQVQYGSTISAGTNTYADIFDDFYIGDGTGSANTSWINPGVIVTRFATTNQSVQFTPLAGTNYQEISVNPFGGDSNYNSSPNVGNKDLFSDSGTLSGNYTPLFVKVQQVSRADNSSGRQAANLLVSNSSTVTGSSATKSTTYTYNDTYAINDPSTSGTWTQTSVDAVKWGYKVAG